MSRYLKPQYQNTIAYVPGEQPREQIFLKLNTNESPYPPAPAVIEAIDARQVSNLRLYADPTCKCLKEKIAALYHLNPENVFLSNGSDDILNFAFMAFADKKGVAFPDITYGFYKVYSDLYHSPAQQIPLEPDFSIDYRKYCGLGKMIVIANPNAPTGFSIPVSQIEEIIRSNPDSVVLIDEAYIDFGGDSCLPLIEHYDNLLVARTCSKSRCLAGGRLGYAFGSPELIADLEKIKFSTNPYSISRLTMVIGEATFQAEDYYQKCCQKIIAVRNKLFADLCELGFEVLPSQTNFLFARTDKIPGEQLYLALRAKGILVRHFNQDRISDYVRITIGTAEQMDFFTEAVKSILKEASHENQ